MSDANVCGYVYRKAEPGLFIVGHYAPDGDFEADSEHATPDAAADRVHYLNGGGGGGGVNPKQLDELRRRIEQLEQLERERSRSSFLFA